METNKLVQFLLPSMPPIEARTATDLVRHFNNVEGIKTCLAAL